MQFIKNGPDIPNHLLYEHEQGNLIFFCGAGISCPAGLPLFKDLVKKTYRKLWTHRNPLENHTFKESQYDRTIFLLEQRYPGGRFAVRKKIANILTAKSKDPDVTMQSALLKLGRDQQGILRLVTTNFDRLFHFAAQKDGSSFIEHAAPKLPIPKRTRWNGLVYLHGLLHEDPSETDLNQLVLSSGDFGSAYLSEQWAARFLQELFQNYSICFIGYSLNDAVLRYMTDALAADRLQGEKTNQIWAFSGCTEGEEEKTEIDWKSKGVSPILYRVNMVEGKQDHTLLYQTFSKWAATYEHGPLGKNQIIDENYRRDPGENTVEDDFVGRVVWALSDRSGIPAKHFSELDPVPSLDWLLGPFSEKCFGIKDLPSFGILPNKEEISSTESVKFSLMQHPTPWAQTPLKSIKQLSNYFPNDPVLVHLFNWLLKYLNDPNLLLWIAKQGGTLTDYYHDILQKKLVDYARNKAKNEETRKEIIKSNSADTPPSSEMKILWWAILNDQIFITPTDIFFHFQELEQSFSQFGLTSGLRIQLQKVLTLKLKLNEQSTDRAPKNNPQFRRPTDCFSYELTSPYNLATISFKDLLNKLRKTDFTSLFEDTQTSLQNGLDLICMVTNSDEWASWKIPSISDHYQNNDWNNDPIFILTEVLRNCWLSILESDNSQAIKIAKGWIESKYIIFKRLALFAASQDGCISSHEWFRWITKDSAELLWNGNSQREICRLLFLQGKYLSHEDQGKLELLIVKGPVSKNKVFFNNQIWLRLLKLKSSGLSLGAHAQKCYAEIMRRYPNRKEEPYNLEEFRSPFYTSDDPYVQAKRIIDNPPTDPNLLGKWILTEKTISDFPFHPYEDTWSTFCCKNIKLVLSVLRSIPKHNPFSLERLEQALDSWNSNERPDIQICREISNLLLELPDSDFIVLIRPISWWLQSITEEQNDPIFIKLYDRAISNCSKLEKNDEKVTYAYAINNPLGLITETLMHLLYRTHPKANGKIPNELVPRFSFISDQEDDLYVAAKMVLGTHLSRLFLIDPEWTRKHLFPLFSWDNPILAEIMWESFSYGFQIYKELLSELKSDFLKSVDHFLNNDELSNIFIKFCTYSAIARIPGYSVKNFRPIFSKFSLKQWETVSQAILEFIKTNNKTSERYWTKNILPFWRTYWPKSKGYITPENSKTFSEILLLTQDEFKDAFPILVDWLRPIEYPGSLLYSLKSKTLCTLFPKETLSFLTCIIYNKGYAIFGLKECLEQIQQADPTLADTREFKNLSDLAKSY